jgi:hypothetical protein
LEDHVTVHERFRLSTGFVLKNGRRSKFFLEQKPQQLLDAEYPLSQKTIVYGAVQKLISVQYKQLSVPVAVVSWYTCVIGSQSQKPWTPTCVKQLYAVPLRYRLLDPNSLVAQMYLSPTWDLNYQQWEQIPESDRTFFVCFLHKDGMLLKDYVQGSSIFRAGVFDNVEDREIIEN